MILTLMLKSDLDIRVSFILEDTAKALRDAGVGQAQIHVVYTATDLPEGSSPIPAFPNGKVSRFDEEWGGWKSLTQRISTYRAMLVRRCEEADILVRDFGSHKILEPSRCSSGDVVYRLSPDVSSALDLLLDAAEELLLDQLTLITGSMQYSSARDKMLLEKKILIGLLEQLPVENESFRNWLQTKLDDVECSLSGSTG